jgi:hypothetical protein
MPCRLHHICDYIISLPPLAEEPEYFKDPAVMLARLHVQKASADRDATALTSALQKGQRSGRHFIMRAWTYDAWQQGSFIREGIQMRIHAL